MKLNLLQMAAGLSCRDLLDRIKELVAREKGATAELIAHIAELENRRLHLSQGSPSLFIYCTRVLHLSEHSAYARIHAARVSRRLPLVLEKLADGSITLTTVSLLGPHLTSENHVILLEEAAHKSRREVEEIVARIHPAQDIPEFVRRLPARSQQQHLVQPTGWTGNGSGGPDRSGGPDNASGAGMHPRPADRPRPAPESPARNSSELSVPASSSAHHPLSSQDASTPPRPSPLAPQESPLPRAVVTPIAPQRYKIQFTAGAGTFNKLQRARDLLRHQVPDGNPATVFDRALTVLVSDLERKRFAAVSRPVTARGPRPRDGEAKERWTRYIPADVRRVVWQRDGGRCAYVDVRGERCLERGWLEFHHVRPHALGGPPSADNLELRCRAHNQFEAELVFGQE